MDSKRPSPTTATEPPWMGIARTMIGQRELPGPVTAPFIAHMLSKLGAWWRDDETPWCATFVSSCLQQGGIKPPAAFYRARAFESWGRPYCPPPWIYRKSGRDSEVAAYGASGVAHPHYRSNDGRDNGVPVPYGAIAVLPRDPKPSNGHVTLFVGLTGDGGFYGIGGNQDNSVSVRVFSLARVLAWRWPEGYPVTGYTPPTALVERIRDTQPAMGVA